MNMEKVLFGFFVLLALTLNVGFVMGDIDVAAHHHVWELFAALVVSLVATVLKFGDRYRHHLILKMRDGGIAEAEAYLEKLFADREGDYFVCDEREAKLAGLHRFAAAGTAIRYKAMHEDEIEDVLALDVALRRNDLDWAQELPAHINEKIAHRLICGHFMCHVLHQDYLVKKGHDAKALKAELLEHLNQRGAEYPAEHNVGHLYMAKPDLADHYMCCDPTNSMNPGIGLMSRAKHYALQNAD